MWDVNGGTNVCDQSLQGILLLINEQRSKTSEVKNLESIILKGNTLLYRESMYHIGENGLNRTVF